MRRYGAEAFQQNVASLVAADRQIDLFEYALQRIITRHLDPIFGKSRLTPLKYRTIKPVLPHCADLLSCLAYWGTDDIGQAQAAFEKAARLLDSTGALAMVPADGCGLQKLDAALDELVMASPLVKKKVIAASTACVAADNRITHEESELLRAIADSLGCPIPPFVPSMAA